MSINERFLNKLAEKLFPGNDESEKFIKALKDGQSSVPSEVRLENGEVYELDNSSVFAASVVEAIGVRVENILDVCAAPGGKSVYAWKTLKPSFILCNETINKRIPMLISNIKRCAVSPAAVSCYDSKVLAGKFPEVFDLVLVDAPCSGQSLLAKGEKAPGALNPATINLNSNRQKRILANSSVCVAPGGYLSYMTCTFSIEENEKVIEWFLKKFPDFKACEVLRLENYRSKLLNFPSYRLYPHYGKGAGAYTVLLKNEAIGDKNLIDDSEKFAWKSY